MVATSDTGAQTLGISFLIWQGRHATAGKLLPVAAAAPQCGIVLKLGCQSSGVAAGGGVIWTLSVRSEKLPCSPGGMWCGKCSVHTGPA